MSDWCTWDEDYNLGIVEVIRKQLVELVSSRPDEYTAVLMQGSGTFCVEAALGSAVRPEDHLLVAANGAYGKRMGEIAGYYRLNCHVMSFDETQAVDPKRIDEYLGAHPEVTHVSVVHCETTTGVLNPLEEIAQGARESADCGCHEQLRGRTCRYGGFGNRFPDKQRKQVHPGRSGIRVRHCPPFVAGAMQGSGPLLVARPL